MPDETNNTPDETNNTTDETNNTPDETNNTTDETNNTPDETNNTTDEINNWWETEEDEEGDFTAQSGHQLPPEIPGSSGLSSNLIWGDTGTMGVGFEPSSKISLQSLWKSTEQFHKADELILMLRFHSFATNISYYVARAESLLYASKTNTQLQHADALTKINQLYFHMLRAYARSQEGDFVKATILWDEIGSSWLDVADEYRQPYILSNLYLTSLCTSDWSMATDYLERLWALIKFMDANKRHAYGAWDEWISCMLVHWIFLKHCPQYKDEFCKEFKRQSDLFNCQKKILVLQHLNDSFISSVIDESYYNRAREMNPELPIVEYEEKPNADL